ncbi:MAG: glutamate-cysteine ligase family protein, partial [Pseudanabaenaceae cyanobacterium]
MAVFSTLNPIVAAKGTGMHGFHLLYTENALPKVRRRGAVVGLLTKGFEVEMYTGTPQGEAVGLSDRIVAALPGFVREPDSRNVEYTTPPLPRYEHLLVALLKPRAGLRAYLQTLGDYTLLPGST